MEGADPGDAWLIGTICDEFRCTPLEALRQPLPLTLEIIGQRAYIRAREAVERHEAELKRWNAAKHKGEKPQPPGGPMVRYVTNNQRAHRARVIAEGRRRKAGGHVGA